MMEEVEEKKRERKRERFTWVESQAILPLSILASRHLHASSADKV
jgi:hypothetical protein